ncbi:MAG: RES family NAD+ phosphorylase [Alphaproteobacteria bacterium]
MKAISFRERGLVRLIPKTAHKPPVLRPLVDTDEEMAALAALEGLTNGRLEVERDGLAGLDPRELAYQRRAADLKVYGRHHINAAFSYTRPSGNRFNGPERGAWYCAFGPLTAIEEVGFHMTRELKHTDWLHQKVTYVELQSDFVGKFPKLDQDNTADALDPDPDIGYPAGQALATAIQRAGHEGLLYPSVRHPDGRCFVAFAPHIVQNVRPGDSWDLVWDGSPLFTAISA